MQDKYSKLEQKVEEGILRSSTIEKVICKGLGVTEKEREVTFSWEMVSVKYIGDGKRLNVVEVVSKNSSTRFVLNKKVKEIQDWFTEDFVNSTGDKEFLNLRIR